MAIGEEPEFLSYGVDRDPNKVPLHNPDNISLLPKVIKMGAQPSFVKRTLSGSYNVNQIVLIYVYAGLDKSEEVMKYLKGLFLDQIVLPQNSAYLVNVFGEDYDPNEWANIHTKEEASNLRDKFLTLMNVLDKESDKKLLRLQDNHYKLMCDNNRLDPKFRDHFKNMQENRMKRSSRVPRPLVEEGGAEPPPAKKAKSPSHGGAPAIPPKKA